MRLVTQKARTWLELFYELIFVVARAASSLKQ